MNPTHSKSETPYGITFSAHAKFEIIAEAILRVEEDDIDSCNLLALTHQDHSDRSSVTRVFIQYLTVNFKSQGERKDFFLKCAAVKGAANTESISNSLALAEAANQAIEVSPQSPTNGIQALNVIQSRPLPVHPDPEPS